MERVALAFPALIGVGALGVLGLSRLLERHPDEGGDVEAPHVLTAGAAAGVLDPLGRLRVVKLHDLLVREHAVGLHVSLRAADHLRARRVRERLQVGVRSIIRRRSA